MAALLVPMRTGFAPGVPQTFEDLGISQTLVLDLVLRRLLLEGYSTLQSLSQTLKVSVPILNIVFTHMRQQQMVEIKGMVGNDYHFTLSQGGKMLAAERFQITCTWRIAVQLPLSWARAAGCRQPCAPSKA